MHLQIPHAQHQCECEEWGVFPHQEQHFRVALCACLQTEFCLFSGQGPGHAKIIYNLYIQRSCQLLKLQWKWPQSSENSLKQTRKMKVVGTAVAEAEVDLLLSGPNETSGLSLWFLKVCGNTTKLKAPDGTRQVTFGNYTETHFCFSMVIMISYHVSVYCVVCMCGADARVLGKFGVCTSILIWSTLS